MAENISILGSTGSIGTQTLEVVREIGGLNVCAITANNNIDLLEKQIREFKPELAAVMDENKAAELKEKVKDCNVTVLGGMEGLIEAATYKKSDTVVTSVVGNIGILPTFEAIKAGKNIALANKETLVSAGELIINAVKENGVKIYLEVVPTPGRDYTVLIDYAHTPDGLENILRSVRDFCRGRLIVLFGCGGDRDRTKRPIMGEIAARLADVLVVTSDNPRTEEPMAIIREILAGIPQTEKPVYVEENRRRAIHMTLRFAQKDDMIVLAGKGHETYQVLGTEKIHFDEREEVAACLQEEDHEQ